MQLITLTGSPTGHDPRLTKARDSKPRMTPGWSIEGYCHSVRVNIGDDISYEIC